MQVTALLSYTYRRSYLLILFVGWILLIIVPNKILLVTIFFVVVLIRLTLSLKLYAKT